MISIKTFTEMVLSFPETSSAPHFDRTAFKAKRIFATLHQVSKTANLMLSPADQSVFCAIDPANIYPVPNKWGLHGATTIELSRVKKDILLDAMTCAYIAAAPLKLAAPFIAAREGL